MKNPAYRIRPRILGACVAVLSLLVGLDASANHWSWNYEGRVLATDLAGASGATTGPDGALYVVEGAAGQVTRIDPRSGRKRVVATNLPPSVIGIGGAIDVAFIGKELYVLVTLVNEFGGEADGIYWIKSKTERELVADIGAFSAANPPPPGFFYALQNGLQFAMLPADEGFLVSDGHHNRLLYAGLDKSVSVVKQYGNSVPTGLAGEFATAYVAQLGAVPNLPEDGKVEAFGLLTPGNDRLLASGVPMIVDVEIGPHGELYALSQGEYAPDTDAGAPAAENTGRLLKVRRDGTFCTIASGINRPTSLDFAHGFAHVVTLDGRVLQYRRFDLISDLICGWF